MRRFTSFVEMLKCFTDIFRGPTMLMTYLRVDGILREKILITVSSAHNCYR